MTYSSSGFKPIEFASRANHHHLINDSDIQNLVKKLIIPPAKSLGILKDSAVPFSPVETEITDIFAIDGGYTPSSVKESFPSAELHFFQFGAVHFSLDALKQLETSQHPNPDDMSKLKNIDRIKLVIPTLNTRREDCDNLQESVRLTLHEFFMRERLGESMPLVDTLAWFLFRRYKKTDRQEEDLKYFLSSNPHDEGEGIDLVESDMTSDYTFECPKTGNTIYLTDTFRLHEQIDDISGATGISGYIAGVVEHLIAIHLIRYLIQFQGGLQRSLLIMDRPTGFFGNTSRLMVPMQDLICWLLDKHNIYLVGIEKSGAFVEHARQIKDILPPSSYLVLGNSHIYKYITPPAKDQSRAYAGTSYYGHKIVFKTASGNMYVISMPVKSLQLEPKTKDIPNLLEVLTHIEQLKCDMYENALLPIALANKLVSLAAVPSSKILESFAKSSIGK